MNRENSRNPRREPFQPFPGWNVNRRTRGKPSGEVTRDSQAHTHDILAESCREEPSCRNIWISGLRGSVRFVFFFFFSFLIFFFFFVGWFVRPAVESSSLPDNKKDDVGPGHWSRWSQRNLRRKIHAISPERQERKTGVESFTEFASPARISKCISGNEKPSKEQSRWRIHLCIPTQRFGGSTIRLLSSSFEILRAPWNRQGRHMVSN